MHNAAKRVSKKRSLGTDSSEPTTKRARTNEIVKNTDSGSSKVEESLALPEPETDEALISETVLKTNRAPLVLAFAVSLLKYTMPDQPLSSRLSLAQAVVTLNSRSKAVSLGLEQGKSAEEEGWGQGQPVVKIMGREVRVLKRWQDTPGETEEEEGAGTAEKDSAPALWGLDLEALRSFNKPSSANTNSRAPASLPIYTPQSARDYLLKSFASVPTPSTSKPEQSSRSRRSGAAVAAEKKRNLALLLGALDSLYSSWCHVLSKDELDRRAWQWYVQTRPDVESGVAGWGAKGELKLKDILALKRKD